MEIKKYNDELVLLNGAFVRSKDLNKLFELSEELASVTDVHHVIEIGAFKTLCNLSDETERKVRALRVGESKELSQGGECYLVTRLSEHFCTAEMLEVKVLKVKSEKKNIKKEKILITY